MQNQQAFRILIKILFWMWLKYIVYITYKALSKNRSERLREWHWNWAVRKFKCNVFFAGHVDMKMNSLLSSSSLQSSGSTLEDALHWVYNTILVID